MKLAHLFALAGLALTSLASAEPSSIAPTKLTFTTYLGLVANANLGVIAQKSNVTIARAQIAVARVFPDPTLTAGVAQYDLKGNDNPTATLLALNVPIVLGGKRAARIDFAETAATVTEAELDDFLRVLRGQASDAYVDSLRARLVLERKRRNQKSLDALVDVNKERLKAGDIGEAALIQSRVEAQLAHADALGAEGEVRATDVALLILLGKKIAVSDQPIEVAGELRIPGKTLDSKALVAKALTLRPDLHAARRRAATADRAIDLVRANRVIDVAVGATWQHNFAASSMPASNFLGLTLTLPLPFSRVYRGDLDVAYGARSQADVLVKATEARVELEVKQAIIRYDAAEARVKIYEGGMLSDADTVLERVLYNYRKGGATLVEVLVAQRTANDVYLSFYDALAAAAHALVAVHVATAMPGPDL